eukprot:Lithocolla_globosa_v1_NODE_6539_length_1071_cov_15.153543.p1 type:complete len:262 gc:universal NODE_6539_length_1071_cov_15.153543:897-112(-)
MSTIQLGITVLCIVPSLFFLFNPRYWFRWWAMNLLVFVAAARSIVYALLNPEERASMSKVGAQYYHQMLKRFVSVELELEGEGLIPNKPCVIVVNHQSSFDMYCLGSFLPKRTTFMAKASLKYLPIFGQYCWLAKTVFVNRANSDDGRMALQVAAKNLIADNLKVFIFPEGTRSGTESKGLLPFKKGAFNLAVEASVPIVPVVISRQNVVFSSVSKKFQSGKLRIKVLPPVQTKNYTRKTVPALVEKVHEQMQAAFVEISD